MMKRAEIPSETLSETSRDKSGETLPKLPGEQLPVMEHFFTLQGEGFHQGKSAYFIRIGGCNVGCPWCDVKESWHAESHEVLACDTLAAHVKNSQAERVVITGGEPAMYDLVPLTYSLRALGVQLHVETSAAYSLTGTWDWVCVSPKKFKVPELSVLHKADELKVVVAHPSDIQWAVEKSQYVSPDCLLFLQAEWSKKESIYPLIVEHIKKHGQWRISSQLHKYLHVP